MEKRYQVFISSTYKDLISERQAIMKAVLDEEDIPAGMELFPAANDSAWELILKVINISDYYVLILGGRYGSIDDTGVSYTEKEYDLALSMEIPIIPLLYKYPDSLLGEKTDIEVTKRKKLLQFREKIERNHHCGYWNSINNLKYEFLHSYSKIKVSSPGIGWIRSDNIHSQQNNRSNKVNISKKNELSVHHYSKNMMRLTDFKYINIGNNSFEILVYLRTIMKDLIYDLFPQKSKLKIYPSWNEIFLYIAPMLVLEKTKTETLSYLEVFFTEFAKMEFKKSNLVIDREIKSIKISPIGLEKCLNMFVVWDLIEKKTINKNSNSPHTIVDKYMQSQFGKLSLQKLEDKNNTLMFKLPKIQNSKLEEVGFWDFLS